MHALKHDQDFIMLPANFRQQDFGAKLRPIYMINLCLFII